MDTIYDGRLEGERIRLIKLPNSDSGKTGLHIDTFDLVNAPPYRALSYTWGSAEETDSPDGDPRSVVIDETKNLEVTPNLHDVLQELQKQFPGDHFWIDAICINQKDLLERSSQVNMMGQIYERAQEVIVWLGENDEHDSAVCKIMDRMVAIFEDVQEEIVNGTRRVSAFDFQDEAVLKSYGLPDPGNEVWEHFVSFFDRRWFSRLWVVQEVVLATNAMVLWGDISITWATLSKCSSFLYVSKLSQSLLNAFDRAKPGSKTVKQIGGSPLVIEAIRTYCEEPTAQVRFSAFWMTGSADSREFLTPWIISLLGLTNTFETSDSRDRVYALIGIMERITSIRGLPSMLLQADYEKRPEDMLLNLASLILQESGSLGLLSFVPDDSLRNFADLPSWVPDFTIQDHAPFFKLQDTIDLSDFDASVSKNEQSLPFSCDQQLLRLNGFLVDAVTETSEPCIDLIKLGNFVQFASLMLSSSPTYPFTGQNRVEVLWRTLIIDRSDSTYPAPQSLARSFTRWLRLRFARNLFLAVKSGTNVTQHFRNIKVVDQLANEDQTQSIPTLQEIRLRCKEMGLNESTIDHDMTMRDIEWKQFMQGAQDFELRAFYTLPFRRIVRTQNGYIALAPQSSCESDEVWIIRGCRMPMILRPVPGTSNKRFRLMGEAYVHGIMNGEAVNADTRWEDLSLI